jgi:hypothetical protein
MPKSYTRKRLTPPGQKRPRQKSEELPKVTAQSRYTQLMTEREPALFRAREAATLTIPSLMPPEGSSGSTTLPQPWQSVGAEGVNNLASKLMLVLFPPGEPYFRILVNEFKMDEMSKAAKAGGEDADDLRGELEEAFGKIERAVVQRLEQRGARMQLFETCKQLIVSGNALLQVLPDERLKLHKLDRYVVKRDQQGNVVELVVKETVAKSTLSDEIQKLIDDNPTTEKSADNPAHSVNIYTHIRTERDKWFIRQEVNGQTIPDSEGSYPADKCPWIPLRFISVDGEDYGRGFVEENIGALRSYDSLEQSLVEGAAVSSRVIFMADEGGVTNPKDIVEAPNGGIVSGRRRDIETLQVEKAADLSVAMQKSLSIEKNLQRAFLLFSGAQRDAERVTAEEIRTIVNELESTFGGVYSVQAVELQFPLANRYLHQMTTRNELPALPEGITNIQIVTGLAGLGRSTDLTKMELLLNGVSVHFGPEAVAEYVPVGAYLTRKATALAIDVSGMIRTEEQVQKAREQKMSMELAKSAIGPMAKLQSENQAGATPQEGA